MKSAPPESAQPPAHDDQPDIYQSGQPGAQQQSPAFAPAPEQPLPRPTPQPTLRVQTGELPPAIEAPGPPPLRPAPRPAPVTAPVAAQPKPTAPPAAAPAPPPAASGPALVQIGAYKTEALAATEWGKVAMDFPSDMSGKGRRVEPVTAGGGTLYRGQITGFSSREAAGAFCAKLKAAGRSCIVK
jgi:cell division protein FtsN